MESSNDSSEAKSREPGFNNQATDRNNNGGNYNRNDNNNEGNNGGSIRNRHRRRNRKKLWMGSLQPWMDENYLRTCLFPFFSGLVSVNVVRDSISGVSKCFAFIAFEDVASANHARKTFRKRDIPGITAHGICLRPAFHTPGAPIPQQSNNRNTNNSGNDDCTVYVEGKTFTPAELRSLFSGFGRIVSIFISPIPPYALVTFESPQSAAAAIASNSGLMMGNVYVNVAWAWDINNGRFNQGWIGHGYQDSAMNLSFGLMPGFINAAGLYQNPGYWY